MSAFLFWVFFGGVEWVGGMDGFVVVLVRGVGSYTAYIITATPIPPLSPHTPTHTPHHRNHRPSWNASVDEPVAGNYYPVNAAAFLHDTSAQFAVVVDRSQVRRFIYTFS